jgi:hypothetical protein
MMTFNFMIMDKAERIAAIAAITQIFKYYGAPSNWCPMIAIALGAIMEYSDNPTSRGIIDGVITGAMVTGAYGMLKGAGQTVLGKSQSTDPSALEPDDDRGV